MPRAFKIVLAIGIVLDTVLIVLFVLWLVYAKSAAEFAMLAEETGKVEAVNRDLFRQLRRLEEGLPIEYSSDVVLSVANLVLDKMQQALFPVDFPLEGDVEGTVTAEQLSDFQFIEGRRILFRIRLVGRGLKYNPRGDGLVDKMLAGVALKEEVVIQGTGEAVFTFEEEAQRLDMRLDIAGIDLDTGLPQFVEKMIKDRFAAELRDKPNYIEFDFRPLKLQMGAKTRWGYYHVRDVVTCANRLMAIADLEFRDEAPPKKKKKE